MSGRKSPEPVWVERLAEVATPKTDSLTEMLQRDEKLAHSEPVQLRWVKAQHLTVTASPQDEQWTGVLPGSQVTFEI